MERAAWGTVLGARDDGPPTDEGADGGRAYGRAGGERRGGAAVRDHGGRPPRGAHLLRERRQAVPAAHRGGGRAGGPGRRLRAGARRGGARTRAEDGPGAVLLLRAGVAGPAPGVR